MTRGAAESILHGLVAALAVAAILSLGRIRDPQSRLRFWWIGLGCPVLFTPLFAWLCPSRLSEAFRDDWALFSGDRLAGLAFSGLAVAPTVTLVLAAAGLLLYLRDLVPFVVEFGRSRGRRNDPTVAPEGLVRGVAAAAAAQGTAAPPVCLLESRHPILSCRGWRRPVIVASRGLLARLGAAELDAALAHEIAHAKRRDPALGWGLMLLRGLCFFNPSVQLCARALAHVIEQRADQDAVRAIGSPAPVLSSLRKLTDPGELPAAGRRAWHAYRLGAVAERCRALGDWPDLAPAPRWTLAATAIGLGVILFFTVA